MPTVITPSKLNSDGTSVINFVDCVGTTVTTYSYAVQQDRLQILNKGKVNLTLNVGSYSNVTITPGQTWVNDVDFSSFTIVAASSNCEFSATSTQYVTVNSTTIKGPTASRPTATSKVGQMYFDTTINKPIWLKVAGTWVDATGTVV